MSEHKKNRRWTIAIFCLLAVLFTGVALITRFRTLREDPLRAFTTPRPTALSGTPGATRKPVVQIPASFGENPSAASQQTPKPERILGAGTINIVLMGLDSNVEREEKGQGWRSDTIAILVIDVNRPACTVINVPRDTRVRVRKISSSGKTLGTQYNKINAAFQYGGGPEAFGHENLIWSLEELLFDGLTTDMRLGFYCSIDMDGIEKFADAVNGVPITLAYDIANFGKKGETILLEGEKARKFVRLRHGITGGSDLGRIERQQAFIRAFASRVKEIGAKEAVPRLWSSLAQYVNTNLSTEQIVVLGDLLSRLNMGEVEFVTLPGSSRTIEDRSYYVPNTKKVKQLALSLWS